MREIPRLPSMIGDETMGRYTHGQAKAAIATARADERRKVWEEAARMAEARRDEASVKLARQEPGTYGMAYCDGVFTVLCDLAARLRAKAGNGE